MPTYDYVGPFPRTFSALRIGVGAAVEPAPAEDDAPPRTFEPGSTVELYPGDVLTTDEPVTHAELALRGAPEPQTQTGPAKEPDAAGAPSASAVVSLPPSA